jgi:hypothetical protein
MIGQRPMVDVALTSLMNIPNDTFYSPGFDTLTVFPQAEVTNIGYTNIPLIFHVILSIPNLNYFCDTTLEPLSSGQSVLANFAPLQIIPNIPFQAKLYSNFIDSNRFNDTIVQNSLMLKGAKRKILLEEWTSTTSPACANNNIFLDTFVNNNITDFCSIKYHLGYPGPGNDSMYLLNPIPQDQRRAYYGINSLPTTILDGAQIVPTPYNSDSSILAQSIKLLLNGSPILLDVSDVRIPGDTIQSTIDFRILQNLGAGNYKLRVMVIERVVNYQNPPGLNGEKTFYDVFRTSLTDSSGIAISPLSGRYNYIYKYQRSSNWVDSMIYTIAFIQNDNTKEIINSAKGRNILLSFFKSNNIATLTTKFKPDIIPEINLKNFKYMIHSVNVDSIYGDLKYEFFEEALFPPTGWNLINKNIGFTFNQISSINGNLMQGFKSMQMPFYNNANIGQRDTLISVVYSNVYPTDTLKFDYAYAQYLSSYADSLKINISTDGGLTFTNIFDKGGSILATALSTTLPFAPSSPGEWKTFLYPLNQILPLNTNNQIPDKYELKQNYPNPFNPVTKITYSLPRSGFVTLKVYDITGREIRTLINQLESPGTNIIEFDGKNLSSGVYFYVLKVNEFREVKKMVLIK